MTKRIRFTGFAGSGALVLVLALSGVVAAASVLGAVAAPTADPVEADAETALVFTDADGDGVEDACDEDVVADEAAAAEAEAAVDVDADGTISVPEAARSDRTGGTNCNHGGYVSRVAGDDDETEETTEADEPEPAAECETEVDEETEPAEPDPLDEEANAHGKAVAEVAQSDAVGGKNCNHGGAVSEAAHKDHEALAAERAAAKDARLAAREARRAEKPARGN